MHTIEKIVCTAVRYVECIAIINNKEFTDRNGGRPACEKSRIKTPKVLLCMT